jgi:hypothetical protein
LASANGFSIFGQILGRRLAGEAKPVRHGDRFLEDPLADCTNDTAM